MKKIGNRLFLLLGLIGFVFSILGLSSCNEDSKTNMKLVFEQKEYELMVGEKLDLNPIVENAGDESLTFIWKSYNEDVASVENGTIVGKLIGKTQIKVSIDGKTNINATITIKVVSANQDPIVEFETIKKILNLNDTFQIKYKVLDEENVYTPMYLSLNEEVLTVDETGLITAHSEGSAVVVVKFYDSKTGKFISYNFSIDVYEHYPINYVLDGGINNENNPDGYIPGQKPFALEPANKEGYKFAGWYDNEDLEGTAVTKVDTTLESEITLYAKWIELTYVVAETFDPSKEYVFGMVQENLNQKLFMTGKLDGYYGQTVNDPYEAGKIAFIEVEGGYNIKVTLKDGIVKYLDCLVNGSYKNVLFNNTPTSVWTYNEEYNTFTTVLEGTTYYLGTYGTYKTFSASSIDKAATSFVGHLYEEVEYTDELKAEDILLEIETPSSLIENYDLPVVENVEWSLKEESNYATINGDILEIQRPAYKDGDANITLIASCTINDTTVKKEYLITITKKEQANTIKLTVDSLGIPSQAYTNNNALVKGFTFEWVQIGNYGDGLQMRDKDGNTTTLWNSSVFSSGIEKIELVYSSTKSTYNNNNAVIFSFGNNKNVSSYTTKLSTKSGVKTYTITPNSDTYTYFKLEHDYGYTFYWESITIVLKEDIIINEQNNQKTYTAKYPSGTTTKMTGGNDAALLGLDPTLFNVVGEKCGSNYPGLNKDGEFRLYKPSGSSKSSITFTVTSGKIKQIIINAKSNGNMLVVYVDDAKVQAVDGVYAINASSFKIVNEGTDTIKIKTIDIVVLS